MIKDTNGQKDEETSRIVEQYLMCHLPNVHFNGKVKHGGAVVIRFVFDLGSWTRYATAYIDLFRLTIDELYSVHLAEEIKVKLGWVEQ